MNMRGKKPQRAGAFRNWRSKLGGGWRLDDDGHNRSLLPKTTKPKVKKVSRLITAAEYAALQTRQRTNMEAMKARLNVQQWDD